MHGLHDSGPLLVPLINHEDLNKVAPRCEPQTERRDHRCCLRALATGPSGQNQRGLTRAERADPNQRQTVARGTHAPLTDEGTLVRDPVRTPAPSELAAVLGTELIRITTPASVLTP